MSDDVYFPLLGTNRWVASSVTGTHRWVAFGDPLTSTRWYPKWHLYQQSNRKKKLLCSQSDVGPIRSRRLRPLRDQVIGCTTFQSLSEVISLPFRLDPHFIQLTKCYENPQPHCSGHRSSSSWQIDRKICHFCRHPSCVCHTLIWTQRQITLRGIAWNATERWVWVKQSSWYSPSYHRVASSTSFGYLDLNCE